MNAPVVISTSPTTPIAASEVYSDGISGDYPLAQDDATFTLLATRSGPSTLYIGSTNEDTPSIEIYVDGACYPSATHYCVTYDIGDGPPGRYLLDQADGQGPQAHATVALNAGTPYIFEIVEGKGETNFIRYPFALTKQTTGVEGGDVTHDAPVTGGREIEDRGRSCARRREVFVCVKNRDRENVCVCLIVREIHK